jgi:glycerophosphoryl diester phosphodiesterase
MIFLIVILVLIVVITPRPKPSQFRWLRQTLAHRGLFDEHHPENTFGAFQLAINQGLGIECDLRLTADNVLVVFHDPHLKRLCQSDLEVSKSTYEEIKTIPILNTSYTIMKLEEFLNQVSAQVPIMLEIKPNSRHKDTIDTLYNQLRDYQGLVSIVSFDPRIVKACKKRNDNKYPIGQIIEQQFTNKTLPYVQRFALTINAFQRITKADFISVSTSMWPYYQWMTWFSIVVGVWPVRTVNQLKKCNRNNIAIVEKEAL